jgi:methylmalonyl-CoA mutase
MPPTRQADGFPPASYADWQSAAMAARAMDKSASRLRASVPDEFPVETLYAPGGPGEAEAHALAGRVAGLLGAHPSWRIRQAFALGADPGDVQDALVAGMDSLELVAPARVHDAEVLDAIARHDRADLELSFTNLDPVALAPGLASGRRGSLSLGFDPIGHAIATGQEHSLAGELAVLGAHAAHGVPSRALRADGVVFDASNAGVLLGRTASVALAYLRLVDDAGLDLAAASRCIEMRLPCDSRFFRSIALLRAARLVWARVLELADVADSAPLYLVAASTALPGREPWIGALCNSVVAFAGAVGGADVVQLAPGERLDAMSANGPRRLACTTPLIAREEACLRRVADPAEGSWFLETMTAAIATAAWEELARLDSAGGVVAAMRSGTLSA